MSNNVKIKFAGLLRGMLRRLEVDEVTAPQAHRPITAAMPSASVAPAAARPPAAPSPFPVAHSTPPASAEPPDSLQLPLQSILATLPMDLRAKVMQAPPAGATISVPLGKILTQLAFGNVKITFGELRKVAPGVFVNSGGEHDQKSILLPLNEILSRLNPALLSRRPTQKQVELNEEIAGPFGVGGEGAEISVAAKPTPSTELTSLRMNASPASFAFARRDVAPAAGAATPPARRPFTPPAAAPAPGAAIPPARSFTPHTAAPATKVPTPPARPFTPRASTPPTVVVSPRSNGAPKSLPPPAPPSPAPQTPGQSGAIVVPLAALSENWPEGLRLEIRQSNLAHAQVLLPAELIEPALKRGRITFTWRNLRPLIKPPPPPTSIHDGVELDLPLSVIAPLFFARQKAAFPQHQTALPPAEIPNLFFGFPQAESAEPGTPPPPAPRQESARPAPPAKAPAPPPVQPPVQPVLKPVDAKLHDTNYYVWSDMAETPRVDETEYKRPQKPATDFSSRHATPNEIVARAMALPGVMGAIVALPDGLKVASEVPSDLNADTLAAFLPQIFDRVGQSTRELRMGALNNFNFTVGNVPWKIFRVNAVYFAAFGRAGEALPSVQLAALAAELDRKKQ